MGSPLGLRFARNRRGFPSRVRPCVLVWLGRRPGPPASALSTPFAVKGDRVGSPLGLRFALNRARVPFQGVPACIVPVARFPSEERG